MVIYQSRRRKGISKSRIHFVCHELG